MLTELDKRLYKIAEAKCTSLVDRTHNDYMCHVKELMDIGLYSDVEEIDPIDKMFPDEYFSHLVMARIVTMNNMLIRNLYICILKPIIMDTWGEIRYLLKNRGLI